jgi:hypothetical protein
MTSQSPTPVEYLTIIAPTAAEAMAQFAQRGLAAQGYAIAGQIGRHDIVRGDRGAEPLAADGMVAATFRRTVAA